MPTVNLTTSPSTLDAGTAASVLVVNTGTSRVLVSRGGVLFRLRPGESELVLPEGVAVSARVDVGQEPTTGTVVTTVTAVSGGLETNPALVAGFYPRAAADAAFVQSPATGNPTLTYEPTPDIGAVTGWTIAKPGTDLSTAPGIRFKWGSTSKWASPALDYEGEDLVFSFDYALPGGGTGDTFRQAHGGFFIMGPAIGTPTTTRRLNLVSKSAASGDTCVTLLYFTVAAGAATNDYFRGQTNSIETFNIDTSGRAGFGVPFSGRYTASVLECKGTVSSWQSDGTTDPRIVLEQSGGANPRSWGLQVFTTGVFGIRDNTGAVAPLQISGGAPSAAVLITTTGVRLGGTTLGFYNSTPVTKPSVTGSRGGNAALTSLLTQLAALGLITDGTTA